MVHGLWLMVYCVWFMVYGLCFFVFRALGFQVLAFRVWVSGIRLGLRVQVSGF